MSYIDIAKHLALLNVIFPVKMTPIHKQQSLELESLGGQGVIGHPISLDFQDNILHFMNSSLFGYIMSSLSY